MVAERFWGRASEMTLLSQLRSKPSASLFVCNGRRRIGKSRLIREFGKSFDHYLEFQGLPPAKGQTNQDQLDNFVAQIARQSDFPQLKVENWDSAFTLLSRIISKKRTLVLLDEISWMGRHDRNFPGKLKLFWDTVFSRKSYLILGICGSVSSWIEENILNSTDFVGRISLTLTLRELPVEDCNGFFGGKRGLISANEKLRYLAVMGGVPKYLEEIDPNSTFEQNINRLCFSRHGFLYNELQKLFSDSFDQEKAVYREIAEVLQSHHATQTQIIKELGRSRGGNYTLFLEHLEQAGFVRKDQIWNLSGKKSRISRYRLSDNYSRFYLRCIAPLKEKIDLGIEELVKFENLSNWKSILGLQFENLVYSNISTILKLLNIAPQEIETLGPYWQAETSKTKGACQIDLMILSKFDTLYICELKLRRRITADVITEVQKKISVLKRPKYLSIRPVLIYSGELEEELEADEFFYRKLDFARLFDYRTS